MSNALVKASTLVIMPSDPSTGDPVTTEARLIETSDAPTFSDSYDTIERNVIRQAFSTYAPVRGLETTSGSINVELHGSGSYNIPPESALLYKSAFGGLIAPVVNSTWHPIDDVLSTTIDTAGTGSYSAVGSTSPVLYTCTISVVDGSDFQVGYPIRIHIAGVIKTIGFITVISTNDITFVTENNATLADADTVDCGYLFVLRNMDETQITDTPEVNFDYYRGNLTRERWNETLTTEFSIDFSTGQICLPSFSWEGTSVGYSTASYSAATYTGINSTFDSENTSPLVVQLADIFMHDGSDYTQDCISNVQITVSNSVYKKQCIASLGIGEVIRTSRAVTGSLNTFYEDKEFQEAFKNDTDYNFRAIFNYAASLDASGDKVFGTAAGNIIALGIPQLKFSEVGIEEEEGIFKYANSFSAEPVEGDDEVVLAFL